jgi:RimJ/RimL family protein N-acetyltransferase
LDRGKPHPQQAGQVKISYRNLRFDDAKECELLAQWYNDPAIKHLYSLFPDEESLSTDFMPEHFRRQSGKTRTPGPHRSLIVLVDGVPAGEAKYEFDTRKVLTKTPNTAWISVMIGESQFRGHGLGKRIVSDLEEMVSKAGAQRIEIGVFEYNTRSLSLFESLGYQEFCRRPNRVWWNNQKWAEVRLLKPI